MISLNVAEDCQVIQLLAHTVPHTVASCSVVGTDVMTRKTGGEQNICHRTMACSIQTFKKLVGKKLFQLYS